MQKKTLGSFLAELRKEKGITQRELAEFLNVSDKTVSHWERDENSPDLSVIPIIAEFFGVSCDELIKGERKTENNFSDSHLPSNVTQDSENFVKNLNKEKISKAYGKHKILCVSSVFISFFSLMLLVGIILLAEHLTGFDFIREAVCVAVAFALTLCLLITFISKQSFNTVINTTEITENEKKNLRLKGWLSCTFPFIFVALVLFLIFMVLYPISSPSSSIPLDTIPVPSSVEPDTSYFDASVEIYAETSEFIY